MDISQLRVFVTCSCPNLDRCEIWKLIRVYDRLCLRNVHMRDLAPIMISRGIRSQANSVSNIRTSFRVMTLVLPELRGRVS